MGKISSGLIGCAVVDDLVLHGLDLKEDLGRTVGFIAQADFIEVADGWSLRVTSE